CYEGSRAQDKSVHEAATLERLAADGFPVPRTYLFEPDPKPLGAPFLVMERLAGGPLFTIKSFPHAFKTFSLGFLGFVRAQARLHRLSASAYRPRACAADGIAADAPLLDRLLGIIGERIERG